MVLFFLNILLSLVSIKELVVFNAIYSGKQLWVSEGLNLEDNTVEDHTILLKRSHARCLANCKKLECLNGSRMIWIANNLKL